MTKEEYENLLQSDYWKGYSYSLIKERNFTCEDCGRSFPNMRNMLQVHHLVYRDANPWSYKPEELIVLCKECHQKRHGIYPNSEPTTEEETTNEKNGEQSYINTYTEGMSKRYAYDNSPRKKRSWFKFAVLVYVIIFLFYFVLKDDSKVQKEQKATAPIENSISKDIIEKQEEITPHVKTKKKSVTIRQETKKKISNTKKEKPLVEQKKSIMNETLTQPISEISQKANMDSVTGQKLKETMVLPKEQTRTNKIKKKTRHTDVRNRSKHSNVWEKVNRKGF